MKPKGQHFSRTRVGTLESKYFGDLDCNRHRVDFTITRKRSFPSLEDPAGAGEKRLKLAKSRLARKEINDGFTEGV